MELWLSPCDWQEGNHALLVRSTPSIQPQHKPLNTLDLCYDATEGIDLTHVNHALEGSQRSVIDCLQ